MAEERFQRRLAAILAVDVVGFSRMMREGETDTLDDESRPAYRYLDGIREIP